MPKDATDYVIAKTAFDNEYQVTKFGDSDQPLNVYKVMFWPNTGRGRCDCPAAAYRGTGSQDKHVKMVANWLIKQGVTVTTMTAPEPKEMPANARPYK